MIYIALYFFYKRLYIYIYSIYIFFTLEKLLQMHYGKTQLFFQFLLYVVIVFTFYIMFKFSFYILK